MLNSMLLVLMIEYIGKHLVLINNIYPKYEREKDYHIRKLNADKMWSTRLKMRNSKRLPISVGSKILSLLTVPRFWA